MACLHRTLCLLLAASRHGHWGVALRAWLVTESPFAHARPAAKVLGPDTDSDRFKSELLHDPLLVSRQKTRRVTRQKKTRREACGKGKPVCVKFL